MNQDIGADCYFHKGKNDHTACQDYALVGKHDGARYGILSDGCSSSPNTDVGARILALVGQRIIVNSGNFYSMNAFDDYHDSVINEADNIRSYLDIGRECLDATLLTMVVANDQIKATMYGDGCLCIKHSDGSITGVQTVYPGGYPKYLSYKMDPERSRQRDIQGGPGYSEEFKISPVGDISVDEVENRSKFDNYFGFTGPIPPDADAVFLFSDGIGQFAEVENKLSSGINFKEPIISLTSIKNYAGQFVRRRAARFLGKECTEKKLIPYDDVSVVGIQLNRKA